MKKHWDNPIEHEMPAEARVPAEMSIGPVRVAPATVLAPMAGVTDTVFRRFIRHASLFTAGTEGDKGTTVETGIDADVTNQQSGCGLLMTEFTSADGLSRMRESKRKRYLTFYEDEHPISAQIFGSNPETLSEAARIIQDTGFDTVDLNLGCPAKRVVGCNGGSGLLRDLPRIGEIFRAVREAVTIPFTVKFRLGWNDTNIVCVELARMAESEGLNAVALHARTREQAYTGQARWEWIAAIKQAVSIPVIGNGDIRTPEDAAAMIAKTGCDAVMIGRAAPANPWIFRQIAQYTATGSYDQPTVEDRYRMIRAYFQMLLDESEASAGDKNAAVREVAGKMKQFASWFTHGVPGGAKLRASIYQAKTGAAVLEQVDTFFTTRLAEGAAAELDSEPEVEYPEGAALVCD
ncbi:tRNA dihydrouridine synthase DusB [Occallatibacter riparius]|uniref:tRNA dihydrouridine synthase DusB n=1 Tax=Occallatibacter riparius TaxID=1002689 RepID=A0A9J7BY69_9BACT|nr:tRNA dihydrouridine synthase DusB [Occallatibacter riparius]UWZ87042.1 tRNA dihydrouridine synthase DusB [Occallatibacter riparius]